MQCAPDGAGLETTKEYAMRRRFGIVGITVRTAMAGASFAALAVSAQAAEYKMTVNRDRLINSANEPQNWLMMNGDYGSTRYSKLAQINRDNVKNLRMVWAMALRGMQDIGQNGPENEVNPLIDNGFMYTADGWGTVYKIDVRSGDQHDDLNSWPVVSQHERAAGNRQVEAQQQKYPRREIGVEA